MELFLLEHKKLWRKTSTRISVFLCFIYVVIFGFILSFQWFSLGSRNDYTSSFGNHFDGYNVIRNSQEYALAFGGELTDESLRQLVRDYQRIAAGGLKTELDQTDWGIINSWLDTLYPELRDAGEYNVMIGYVDPDKLAGFYERRQKAVQDFLENNGQIGAEKEYLLQINANVREPYRYEWVQGWSVLLGSSIAGIGTVMALFLAIALSSLFAGEWQNNISALVFTTRNGWEKLALVKICAGLLFAVELFAIIMAGGAAAQIIFLGTAGWDMPIQTIKLIAIAPVNMLQAEIFEYTVTFLGTVGFAGIVMFLSAKTRSTVLALLLSLAVAYGPMMFAQYLPYEMQKALDLLPLAGSAADIFRTNTFHILGKYVWSPCLLLTVPVLIGALCIPLAVRGWSRRLRA